MEKLRIVLGNSPANCHIYVGDIDLTKIISIQSISIEPISAYDNKAAIVTLELVANPAEVELGTTELVIKIGDKEYDLLPRN